MKPYICVGVLVGLMSAVGLAAEAKAPPAKANPSTERRPKPQLETPDYMPEVARTLIRQRMARHGGDMTDLVLAVTLLQRQSVRELSQRIANEPKWSRPVAGGADDLNAALPERFFVLQDELKHRAQLLDAAAAKKDDAALAAEFGRLAATCVGCHSAYLYEGQKPK